MKVAVGIATVMVVVVGIPKFANQVTPVACIVEYIPNYDIVEAHTRVKYPKLS